MRQIKWTDDLAVYAGNVDAQHRELFDLVNLMLLASQQKDNFEAFENAYDALCRYTEIHFREEEEYMEETGNEHLEIMCAQHKTLYHELRSLWAGSLMPKTGQALLNWVGGRLVVSSHEVVHSIQILKAEFAKTTPFGGGPNEPAQECPFDAERSRIISRSS